jgi:acetone carboxylase gamma subunit
LINIQLMPLSHKDMLDISQFSARILKLTMGDHCTACGETPDRFDRCGCDYGFTVAQPEFRRLG